MTTLAIALPVDSRAPSGLYILTDSRITWGSETSRWDAAQKAFVSSYSADIFGFCGDAFFPPSALRQMIELINAGLLFDSSASAKDRHKRAICVLKSAIEIECSTQIKNFSIFHGSRDKELMESKFHVWKTQFTAQTREWIDEELKLNVRQSYLAHIDGSGATIVSQHERWEGTSAKNTNRAAIWSFCDALHSNTDQFSGGPPQLVGIRRKGVAQHFGFIWCGKRYFCGVEVPSDSKFNNVDWFNQNFERYDGERIKRLPNAQKQPKPPRLSTS